MTLSQHAQPEPATDLRRFAVAFAIPTVFGLLALGVRLWGLGEKSIWVDEALSWRAAHMSFSTMTDFAAGHYDTPLYYAILALWVKAAGNSEVALRLPSVLAGALTVFLLSWAAWRVGGVLLAAVAGALLALNAASVAFSQEARMYPLTGLLALGASVMLASFVVRPTRLRLCAYTILAVSLVYAHYSGWVVLVLHGALFVTYGVLHLWERRDPRVLAGGVVAFALIGIAYIPWYSQFLHAAGTGVPIPAPTWDVVTSVTRASLGLDQSGRFWPIIAVPLLLLGLAGVARRLNDPMVICVSALALVPVAMLDISIVRTPVFNLKQISPYIPGVCFVAAIGVVEAGSLVRRLGMSSRLASGVSLGAATLIAVLAFRGTVDWYATPPGEDWRAATASAREAHQPVYIWQWWADVAANYYLGANDATRPLLASMPAILNDGYVPITAAHQGDQATLIINHSRPEETEAILNSLRPYFSITEPATYWGIHAYSLRAKATAEYNVDLGDNSTWTTTAEGDLRSGENASFNLRSSPVGTPFTLHVEYLDTGSDAFSITSAAVQGQPVALATIPFTGSNTWRTANVPVDDPAALSNKRFTMTPGVTIRTLEMRRYDLEGASVLRSVRSDFRQWFLRRDGYLETIGPAVCVWPAEHLDVARTPTMTIDMTYLDRGHWTNATKTVPAADGLSCPLSMLGPVVVRRLAVHTAP